MGNVGSSLSVIGLQPIQKDLQRILSCRKIFHNFSSIKITCKYKCNKTLPNIFKCKSHVHTSTLTNTVHKNDFSITQISISTKYLYYNKLIEKIFKISKKTIPISAHCSSIQLISISNK